MQYFNQEQDNQEILENSLESLDQNFTENLTKNPSVSSIDSQIGITSNDTDSLTQPTPPSKLIDGFNEATDDLENSVRNFVYQDNKNIFKKTFFLIIIGLLIIMSLFIGKTYYSRNFLNYDDSMILVINQTKVSPQKITIYVKTVSGVNEPIIKITDFLKEEFSPINIDKKNNTVTWFWTLEGNRAKKAFNKQAIIKVTRANKYYQQQFTLDKEIRIEFHR